MNSLISFGSIVNFPEDPGFATFFSHLLRTRTCVDVTFMLESPEGEKEEFHAHKLILAMRSSEFADKFYGDQRQEHYTITLRRVNIKAFKDMIRYCYGCKPGLETTEEACDLFKLAKEYNVVSLMNLCRRCLRDIKINPKNVFSMLDVAEYMQDKGLKDACDKLLEERTRDVLMAYDLRDITKAMVRTIILLPKLSLYSEYELMKWLIDWANAKVEEGDDHCKNAREYLQKLLLFINILALTFEEFALLCKDYPDFFCCMEIANIYLNIAFPGTGVREMPDWYDKQLKMRQYTGSKI